MYGFFAARFSSSFFLSIFFFPQMPLSVLYKNIDIYTPGVGITTSYLSVARSRMDVAVIGSKLIVTGGEGAGGDQYSSMVDVLDFSDNAINCLFFASLFSLFFSLLPEFLCSSCRWS
jgi:hypothetical protein